MNSIGNTAQRSPRIPLFQDHSLEAFSCGAFPRGPKSTSLGLWLSSEAIKFARRLR